MKELTLGIIGLGTVGSSVVKILKENQNLIAARAGCGIRIKKGVVKGETRKITFRDDNFVIDSKSRFSDIVESIPLDSDALIKAITDAIENELKKSGKTMEESRIEQEKKEKEKLKHIAEAEAKAKAEKNLNKIKSEIVAFFTANKTNMDVIKPVLELCREAGFNNPNEIDDLEIAKKILKACK